MDNATHNKLQDLLSQVLQTEGTSMGLIRKFKPDDDELDIVCHQGFSDDFIEQFFSVKPFDHTSCGRAFGIGSTVLINDIEQDLSFKKQIRFLKELKVQFRSVKSAPVLTQRGRKVGILSVFFEQPKWDWHFRPHDKLEQEIAEILFDLVNRDSERALSAGS
ncbi:MAG: hypothetical protein K0R26_2485 [Bacteroidota bacterium]|jgi:hypothetical protein|nr:hypothetical protein [Bacteroidota bacterium]